MMHNAIRRYTIVVAAWLPFFAIWIFFSMIYAHMSLGAAIITSSISMGSASLLGIAVWHVCQRWPWPLRLGIGFYLLHILLACAYGVAWILASAALECLHRGKNVFPDMIASPVLGWEILMGIWLYGLFAGVSYAVQTRNRLQEKETLAARAETLAAAARVDAIRARLNPHFLFNALHTLSALVKFRPALAESAIERLGDMLRYTLKEDGRELVEFSEEFDFTRQYLAFEQLRFEDRLHVDIQADPESFHFELPPFSMQSLAENAVHHAISIRPEGGSIWIRCTCTQDKLKVSVRDDGPGDQVDSHASHQFGLRSLRERLQSAYGESAVLQVQNSSEGFEAQFEVPMRVWSNNPAKATGESA